jgi:hypothetical protein
LVKELELAGNAVKVHIQQTDVEDFDSVVSLWLLFSVIEAVDIFLTIK